MHSKTSDASMVPAFSRNRSRIDPVIFNSVAYLPIEDYGVIGNLRTVALVGRNASIDWLCFPHFDSPSIFAAILDDKKGGRFQICPGTNDVTRKQLYWPDTNILVTRFLSNDGVGEVIDFMPIDAPRAEDGFHGLIRRVKVVRGSMNFRMECFPAFNYARDSHTIELSEAGATFTAPGLTIGLASDMQLRQEDNGVVAEFALNEGQTASFELHHLNG